MEIDEEDEKMKEAEDIMTKGASSLDPRIRDLVLFFILHFMSFALTPSSQKVSLIFDLDMFKDAMKSADIDIKKMPLGKLSKAQIEKGYKVLEEIEEELKKGGKKASFYVDATNRFYTIVPHDFGEQKIPIIDNMDLLKKKYELLEVTRPRIL